jgi:hypothetical protein
MKTFIKSSILFISLFMVFIVTAQVDCEYSTGNRIRPGEAGPDFTLPELPEGNDDGYISEDTISSEDNRLVHFVHGLNGQLSAWDRAASISMEGSAFFPPRMVISTKPEYVKSQFDFKGAATTLREKLSGYNNLQGLPPGYDMRQSIYIGHSQGGLLGRYLDYYYSLQSNRNQRTFGGLVTVATSNQGAWIINAQRQHGLLDKELKSLTSELIAGPFNQFRNNDNVFIAIIGEMVSRNELENKIKNFADKNIGQILIAKNLPPITNSYMVGASMITDTLNTYVPVVNRGSETKPTNIVAFYSIRDTLLHKQEPVELELTVGFDNKGDAKKEIRTIHNLPLPISTSTINYFVGDVNESADFAGMDDEWHFPAAFFATRVAYAARVHHNNFELNEFRKRRNFFLILHHGMSMNYQMKMNRAILRRNAWQRGVDYLDNFDRSYRVIIGALSSENTSRNSVLCECSAVNDINGEVIDLGSRFIQPGEDCESYYYNQFPVDGPFYINCITRNFTINSFQWRHKDSDGVVLAESAMDIPQATFTDPRLLRLENSTHMCIRNDVNTLEILNKIYEGEVGLFFKTELK